MSAASNQIQDGNSLRNKERSDQDRYHAQAYENELVQPGSKRIRQAEEQAKKQKELEDTQTTAPKNFNVNFIDDETFQKELEFLFYKPQGETVILVAPKLKIPDSIKKNELFMGDNSKKEIINEQLERLAPGYRVVAISTSVLIQQARPLLETAQLANSLGLDMQVDKIPLAYKVGDYVFSPNAPIREMNFIQPLDENLSYYEVFHREIRGFVTQDDALRFKPEDKVEDVEAPTSGNESTLDSINSDINPSEVED